MYCIGECAQLIQDPAGVVNTIYLILEGPMEPSAVLVRYAVSTIAKMYTKCQVAKDYARQFLERLLMNADPEIQQRAHEYSIAINDPKAEGLLGAIPPLPKAENRIRQNEYERSRPPPVQQVITPAQ